jgi:molybdate transport system ATP-binding protein
MSLDLDLRLRRGAFSLSARASLATSGLTAIFGPSGAGKSSLLRAIAGFERPEGRIAFDGETWCGPGTFTPAHRRRVATVFQDARLFAHLDVAGNLAYAARRARGPVDRDAVVRSLDLSPLLDRRAATLSGGEAQRVAIARALLSAPRLILMDEPLSSLDGGRRAEILPLIERLRDTAGLPILYVSHALSEVARLADRVLLLSRGSVLDEGPAGEVLARADLSDGDGPASVIEAIVGLSAPDGITSLDLKTGHILSPGDFGAQGRKVRLVLRARDILVATTKPEGLSALNALPATVRSITPMKGASTDIRLDLGGQSATARLTQRSVAALGLVAGLPCYAVVKSVALDRA